MITKPSNIGRWIGAAIATIILVAVSFVGFRAFNARAHAHTELQSGAQSPHSDTAAQSGSQSGDTPQSAQPTPVDVPKPTPPPNLYAGGQIGAPSDIAVVHRPLGICVQYRRHRRFHDGMPVTTITAPE